MFLPVGMDVPTYDTSRCRRKIRGPFSSTRQSVVDAVLRGGLLTEGRISQSSPSKQIGNPVLIKLVFCNIFTPAC